MGGLKRPFLFRRWWLVCPPCQATSLRAWLPDVSLALPLPLLLPGRGFLQAPDRSESRKESIRVFGNEKWPEAENGELRHTAAGLSSSSRPGLERLRSHSPQTVALKQPKPQIRNISSRSHFEENVARLQRTS